MGVLTQAAILVPSTIFLGNVCLRYLRGIVKEIEISQSSILSQHFQNIRRSSPEQRHYVDAFKPQLPPQFYDSKGTQEQTFNVDTYVRTFYSSWLFKAKNNMESVV